MAYSDSCIWGWWKVEYDMWKMVALKEGNNGQHLQPDEQKHTSTFKKSILYFILDFGFEFHSISLKKMLHMLPSRRKLSADQQDQFIQDYFSADGLGVLDAECCSIRSKALNMSMLILWPKLAVSNIACLRWGCKIESNPFLESVLKILKGILWVWVTTQALTENVSWWSLAFSQKSAATGLSLLVGNPQIMTIIYTYIPDCLNSFFWGGGRHHLLSHLMQNSKVFLTLGLLNDA